MIQSLTTKAQTKQNQRFIDSLLAEMTVEEKAGQMTQLNINLLLKRESKYKLIEPLEIDSADLRKTIVQYGVGSILNAPGWALKRDKWLEIIGAIQHVAMQESRLKIPVLYGIDAIHGANYLVEGVLFPQPIAQAASWNLELVEKAAQKTAYETRASGIPWTFSPILDVMRQPLWVRCFETYGEDPYLVEKMALATIKGYEGDDISSPYAVASCMKHFIGYSKPQGGKDRTPAYIPERQLREIFLPPFKAAIDAGAKTLMVNSAEVNGIPVHASVELLTNLLRKELGFNGLVVTDWEDIIKLYENHRTSPSLKHAVKSAIEAGIDMSMVPNDFDFTNLLIELVNEGSISEERLDESVRRILQLKLDLGLFDNPVLPDANYDKVGSQETHKLSYSLAAESITLLKNNNALLPLSSNKKVLLTGPMANSLNMINGAWSRSWQGTEEQYNKAGKKTLLQTFQSNNPKVDYALGCTLDELKITKELRAQVEQADVIVACFGELPGTEKPGDINDLNLSEAQTDYLLQLAEFKKPIVLLLFESRPRIIRKIEPHCAAIIQAYYPSEEGVQAIYDIIYGKVNPSGKLPYTYPRYANDLLTYDRKHTENIDNDYEFDGFRPQFEFGTGLSYTQFGYSDLRVKNEENLTTSDTLHISIKLSNKGNRAGKEAVLLFINDLYASVTPSTQRLRDFKKIEVKAGESVRVDFIIPPNRLSFIGRDLKPVVEPGEFEIQLGNLKKIITLNE